MSSNGPNEATGVGRVSQVPKDAKKPPKPSHHERLERVLDEIAIHRIQMRQAAQVLIEPVHKVERVRQQIGGAKHWLYPAAPLMALLVMRLGFLPRARALPALALRAWGIWRLIARFR